MAQVLKEESREMILEAAKKEFMERGFKDSSMRRIALKSKMTVGNLYRYFKNKEDLLEVIVAPAYRAINKMVSDLTDDAVSFDREGFNFDASQDELAVMLDKLSEEMIDTYVKHKMEFNILMMSSRLNDSIVEWFRGLITGLIAKHYDVSENDRDVNMLAQGYAIAIFHGIREILMHSDADRDNLKRLTKIYLNSYLSMLNFDTDRYQGTSE